MRPCFNNNSKPVQILLIKLKGLLLSFLAGDVPVQYCPQPTNGMVYFRAFSSLNTLPEELRPYVPLFCNVLTK